jgi:predicted nucleic acid-binding protein
LSEGCPGFDTYFIALAEQESLPLFTDDLGMHQVCEKRKISSRLVRELDPATLSP